MKNIKYFQPIFAPTLELMNRNLNSIISFFEYYDSMNYSFDCIFGGYSADDAMWGTIADVILSHANTHIVRFDSNYGKAYVINELTKKYLKDAEYLLTADSDIIYKKDQADIIERLIEAFDTAKTLKLNPSLISLYQEVSNCHILEMCYENKYYYRGKYEDEMICCPNGDSGVAGGCLFISSDFWKFVNGYKILGVYAGDDSGLMVDSFRNGYHFFMSNSIRCIHPIETNNKYAEWKVRACHTMNSLENAIENASAFWKDLQ